MRHLYTQTGIAIILFLTFLVLGATALLLSQFNDNRTTFMLEDQAQTARALAQAKEALLSFAISYAQTHNEGQPQGYLPCPDYNGDGSASTCGTMGHSVIGRFPWKTLGLPPLRDGSGECLWYAVSGSYKDNPKDTGIATGRILTSDSNGLFLVKNFQNQFIAGTTEAEQAIAIIFAPGRALAGQERSLTAPATECGSTDLNDNISKASNYLDSLNNISNATGDRDITDNSNDDEILAQRVYSANFWVTGSPSDTPTFISAPRTTENLVVPNGDSGKVVFNDALILITLKDYESIYTQMDFWIAKKVTECIADYAEQNRSNFRTHYLTAIGDWETPAADTYRNTYDAQIDKYVDLMEQKFIGDYHKKNATEPTATEIQTAKDEARENAIEVDLKYSWATLIDDLGYTAKNGRRFGRIPDTPINSTINAYIQNTWADTNCFNESTGFDTNEWGWWKEWKERVFYAIDDDNTPDTTTYMWVKLVTTKDSDGNWMDWVAGIEAPFDQVTASEVTKVGEISSVEVNQTKEDTLAKITVPEKAPGEITKTDWVHVTPTSSGERLELCSPSCSNPDGAIGADFVVLVAGRELLLNKGSTDINYPEYQQTRSDIAEKKRLKNYLEGKAKPLNPSDSDLNDPDPAPEKYRKLDGGGNLPQTGLADILGDETFIRKPIIPGYFNDIACKNGDYNCQILK